MQTTLWKNRPLPLTYHKQRGIGTAAQAAGKQG
jgi:hypothetical protein